MKKKGEEEGKEKETGQVETNECKFYSLGLIPFSQDKKEVGLWKTMQ